jgi:alpha-L-arabinofuranosidase
MKRTPAAIRVVPRSYKNRLIGALLLLSVSCSFACSHEYHVSIEGNDQNPGTASGPFRTISAAAQIAGPGDIITVHRGIYRERVNPPRGGLSDKKRIIYQAATGEKVEITGSERIRNWIPAGNGVWKVVIPNVFFGKFNPYSDLIHGDWFFPGKRQHHTGAVYLNGDWLFEAATLENVTKITVDSLFWFGKVGEDSTYIWAQFRKMDPNVQQVEINVRQSVFYPEKTGINYITLRGFTLRNAATPWAPPTAEQIGLVGTHWSRGWIIENNVISHSVCSGISLGKYGDKWDNTSEESAKGYIVTIERALKNGWNGNTTGHHIVRNNAISHCEQAGIIGSLGAIFSKITGNTIHDIHVRRLFSGCEQAGIKLHGAIDVEISRNHIYHCCRGIWLDWMAQGARISGNIFHDNGTEEDLRGWGEEVIPGGLQDLFVEVNHGPFLVDNNIFLSPYSLNNRSQGGAYVHNLFAGAIRIVPFDGRETPYLREHSTEIAGLHNNACGDDRFYNNLFVERGDLSPYDSARLPVMMNGNVFFKGARPSGYETEPILLQDSEARVRLVRQPDGFYLGLTFGKSSGIKGICKQVTTAVLGKAIIPDCAYENPDGTEIAINTDFFGHKRSDENPAAGPFEQTGTGDFLFKVW